MRAELPLLWRQLAIAASMPLIWGVALPRYLLLDPIAAEAATGAGLWMGGAVVVGSLAVSLWRLRAGPGASFAFAAAVDLAVLTAASALVRRWLALDDPRVPYVESFSLMNLHLATGWAGSLGVYVWCRRRVRRASGPGDRRGLPGVRTVYAFCAAVLGVLAAVSLGVGSSARAAGVLDRQAAAELGELARLMGAAMDHAEAPGVRRALLAQVSLDGATRALLLPSEARPPDWRRADRRAPVGGATLLLRGDARLHAVRRWTRHGALWLLAPANVRPPVRAPEDAPAMLILAFLVLGAPLAAWAVGEDLREQIRDVTDALTRLGAEVEPDRLDQGMPGVPVASNDEVGDLAVEINATCRRFVNENRRLSADLEAAASSDRAQSRFLAAANHQLRTPLTTISGYCHLLAGRPLSEAQREDVRVIGEATCQLQGHVDEILNLSRIEAGQEAPLERAPVDLGALARAVLQGRVAQRAPGVVAQVDERGAPGPAWADPQRCRQVLENLLSNALKFTREGFIQISVGPATLDGLPAVQVSVADSGPGIPEAELEAIFSEFHRVEAQREVAGTGLGLAIARRLVGRMRGRLWVESVVGEGATFHLVLPAAPGPS